MNLDRDVCERKYLEWLSGGRKEKKFAFIHERLFFKVFTPFVNSLFLSIPNQTQCCFVKQMLFCQTNAVLSNKCQLTIPIHTPTLTYSLSSILTPNFHFDLISLSNSIHFFLSIPQSNALIQSISIKSEPHKTGALLVQDSFVKTVILLSKRYSSFFPCVHFLPFLLIPNLSYLLSFQSSAYRSQWFS